MGSKDILKYLLGLSKGSVAQMRCARTCEGFERVHSVEEHVI